MEVVLLKHMENLGEFGDRVKVADGYARNYLFPRRWATRVSDVDAKQIENEKKRIEREKSRVLETANEMADKLAEFKVVIKKKVHGEQDKLFGSLTTADVAGTLKDHGLEVDRKNISLPEEHIRELGTYQASVKLHPQVTVELKVKVEKE